MNIGKTKIEFNTFFKKGLKPIDDRFGVYEITGKQGSGKTYYAVKLVLSQDLNILNKIYTNIKSLKIDGYDINYFDKIKDIYYNTEEYCIFLIDEIARLYPKNAPCDVQFYAWLNQCRKRKRIVIMCTQEWKELPMWLRRPVKYNITTNKTILSRFGIYKTCIGDGENLVYDKDEGEYYAPPIKYIIYKRNKYIASLYDTYEAVNTL